jgi:hypothetical protein
MRLRGWELMLGGSMVEFGNLTADASDPSIEL